MITLQPISEDNFRDVLKLRASEELVAPNFYSLAEAYCSLIDAVNKGVPQCDLLFAIVNDKTVVGFAMMTFEDGKDVNSDSEIYWMSRFMIDENHQAKGYGKAALALLIDHIKTKPHDCDVKYFYTAVVPTNHIATKTYASLGFEKTGQVWGSEDVMRLIL